MTTSAPGEPVGSQRPRLALVPKALSSAGEDARDVAKAYGFTPLPWQEYVLEATLGERPDGRWAAPRVGISLPRQNGKNGYVEARELAGLLLFGERILHTAHEVKTAMMAFRRLRSYFETNPKLKDLVVRISNTNGQEGIWLSNGAYVQFIARSKSSGRGFSVDTLILDEAQELSDDTYAAISPTVSASHNPQIILLGTPPGPTTNGAVFARFREGGLTGTDGRLCWLEWSAADEDDQGDPATWAKANASYNLLIERETISDEYAAMDDEVFGRERLGKWTGTTSYAVIAEDTWESLRSDSLTVGKVTVAIDVSPDRSRASVAVAGYLEGGQRVQVEIPANRKGTGWVVEVVKRITSQHPYYNVVLDSGGPAASLLPDLQKAHIRRVQTFTAREVVQACGFFYDAAYQGRLAHAGEAALNEALAAARKRPLGEAWAWHRKDNTADITPLVAATFAAYALSTRRTAPTSGGVLVL